MHERSGLDGDGGGNRLDGEFPDDVIRDETTSRERSPQASLSAFFSAMRRFL